MSLGVEIRRLSRGASLLGVEEMMNKEDSSAHYLPKYTLFYIFTFLNSRRFISKCKQVCKLWNVIASDSIFGWVQALAMPLGPENEALEYVLDMWNPKPFPFDFLAPIKRATPIDFKTITPLSPKIFSNGFGQVPAAHYSKYKITAEDGKDIYTGVCYFPGNFFTREVGSGISLTERQQKEVSPMWHNSEQFLTDLVNICNKNRRLWRCELWERKHHKFPYVFTLEINIVELETMVEKGQIIPLADVITYHAFVENVTWAEKNISRGTFTKTHIPMKSYATQQQPMGFSKSIRLYKYQLDAVSWMKSVEDDIHVGFEVVDAIAWRSAKTTVLFKSPYVTEIVPVHSVTNHINRLYPKGGVLGDDMGLGGEILANPGDPLIISPLAIDCEINSMKFIQKMSVRNKAHLFKTNATLVICPDHLVKQWHEEIEKNTRPHLNVVAFSDIRSLKGCPYGDIVNADIVIMPASLLEHQSYLSLGSECIGNNTKDYSNYFNHLAVPREQRINEYLERLWKSGREVMQVKGPVLEHFLWRRVVLDEAHDLVRESWVQSTLQAKFWWYVSGTPFPNVTFLTHRSNVLKRVLDVLKLPTPTSQIMYNYAIDIVLSNLYWRNTKQSVKNEYEVPPIVEDLVLLDLTPIEKLLLQFCEQDYGNSKPDQLMAVSHIGLGLKFGLNVSLTKLRLQAIKHLEERTINNRETIRLCHVAIAQAQLKLQQLEDEDAISLEKRVITHNSAIIVETTKRIAQDTDFTQKLTELSVYDGPDMSKDAGFPVLDESDLAALSPKQETPSTPNGDTQGCTPKAQMKSGEELLPFSIVDMTVPQLKEELQSRGISLNSKLRKADLQKLLKEAVKNNVQPKPDFKKRKTDSVNNTNSSPAKKSKTASASSSKKSKDVRTTADKVKEQNVLRWMVENEGTKIGNLRFYLKRLWEDNPAAKVIIFSKFSDVLQKVSAMLEANNVNHNSMEGGNQKAQNQQLKGFKKDSEVRALLLNLSRLSTGTNIIEATHIIFMEPAYEKSQEAQAIGRAFRQGQTIRVTVVRLIARDTIDYKSHMTLHGNSKIKTAEAQAGSHSGQPKIQRTSSLITTLATTPALQNTTEMLSLMEEKETEEAQMVSTPVIATVDEGDQPDPPLAPLSTINAEPSA